MKKFIRMGLRIGRSGIKGIQSIKIGVDKFVVLGKLNGESRGTWFKFRAIVHNEEINHRIQSDYFIIWEAHNREILNWSIFGYYISLDLGLLGIGLWNQFFFSYIRAQDLGIGENVNRTIFCLK